ncbi:unnamed protein product [Leptosia nina]|uniref:Uncharacterized protein n=1 Tax=Leptosia nina TaxID=320188 RepID=A0AAV1JB77_9NEOP
MSTLEMHHGTFLEFALTVPHLANANSPSSHCGLSPVTSVTAELTPRMCTQLNIHRKLQDVHTAKHP